VGGKTLDQFNSRQQARSRKGQSIKDPLPKNPEQEKDTFNHEPPADPHS